MRALRERWEHDVLGVYDVAAGGPLQGFYDFLRENPHLPGDVCEVGVYRGRSLLATAVLLQGTGKRVWGFDSFAGFPALHANDDFGRFEDLHREGRISDDMLRQVALNLEYREITAGTPVTPTTVSSSGDFSGTSEALVRAKARYLGVDNFELVAGDFADTMTGGFPDDVRFCAALLDCDLYLGYKVALPFVWSRLVRGGYVFLDEYYSLKFPGARIAVDEFFADKPDKPQQHVRRPREFERWYVRKLFDE